MKVIAGVNVTVGCFTFSVFIFQIFAYNDPSLADMVHQLGCATCASLWAGSQATRFVIIRSICARGRHDPSAKFTSWLSQMESGVLAAMLSATEGRTIGSPAQVALEGSMAVSALPLQMESPH